MGRYLTALRLMAHWSTGATVGILMASNKWNNWALVFITIHVICQLIYTILEKK